MTALYPYQDAALDTAARVEDLLERLSLEDKAGLMFHDLLVPGADGALAGDDNFLRQPATLDLVQGLRLTHFNVIGALDSARQAAEWHNRLQELAAGTGWGIPISLSTDPRHSYSSNPGASAAAGAFSLWPEPLGLAATRDLGLVERFGDVVRQEYLATGLRVALHPQIDLATEPRWSRIGYTFGEDADLTAACARAYIRGMQTSTFGADSVSTMTKHFPGGGPQKDGEDPHFEYGKEQVYPGGAFEYHLSPFVAAIEAGTRQMMPYYGKPVGLKDIREVGFGFNEDVLTGLLRQRLGFEGIICTDWGLINDGNIFGQAMPARAWGVEHLSPLERTELALVAGADQFGGERSPELVIELVRSGRLSEERIDDSARRLLKEKFDLGLFDHRFVDAERAAAVVGSEDFRESAARAQRDSITVLTALDDEVRLVPQIGGARIYAEGIDSAALARLGTRVDDPGSADYAILRLQAPFEARPGGFERHFHAGSLEFSVAEEARLVALCERIPTVIDIALDRPAILTRLSAVAAALIVSFGSSDEALVDVLLDPSRSQGSLPFDLPSSMAAVEASPSDVAFSTADPLFRFGHGLTAGLVGSAAARRG